MNHYVCTGGCQGVAEKPGVCNTLGCPNYGKPLEACTCADGRHRDVLEKRGKQPDSAGKEK